MDEALTYAIVVEPLSTQDGGGFLATVPALPGCMGDGETREGALADALAAIGEWWDAARQIGRGIPGPHSPGQWRQRAPRTLHDKPRRLEQSEGVSLNQLAPMAMKAECERKARGAGRRKGRSR